MDGRVAYFVHEEFWEHACYSGRKREEELRCVCRGEDGWWMECMSLALTGVGGFESPVLVGVG